MDSMSISPLLHLKGCSVKLLPLPPFHPRTGVDTSIVLALFGAADDRDGDDQENNCSMYSAYQTKECLVLKKVLLSSLKCLVLYGKTC